MVLQDGKTKKDQRVMFCQAGCQRNKRSLTQVGAELPRDGSRGRACRLPSADARPPRSGPVTTMQAAKNCFDQPVSRGSIVYTVSTP
jgi:hypothetical protein